MSAARKIVCVITVLCMSVLFTSCQMPTYIVGSIPDPEKTVTSFFDSVCKGDFAAADNHLDGISISMRYKINGEFSQKLFEYLVKSYSYNINGSFEVDRIKATGKVEFTYLDFDRLSADLKEKSTRLGKQYIAELNENYILNNNGAIELSDEGAERIAVEALDSMMESPELYYSTDTFEINLQYNGNQWKINISDDLFNAVCGEYHPEENN